MQIVTADRRISTREGYAVGGGVAHDMQETMVIILRSGLVYMDKMRLNIETDSRS